MAIKRKLKGYGVEFNYHVIDKILLSPQSCIFTVFMKSYVDEKAEASLYVWGDSFSYDVLGKNATPDQEKIEAFIKRLPMWEPK